MFESQIDMAKLQRINRLSNKFVQDIIDSVDTVLFDVDGKSYYNIIHFTRLLYKLYRVELILIGLIDNSGLVRVRLS